MPKARKKTNIEDAISSIRKRVIEEIETGVKIPQSDVGIKQSASDASQANTGQPLEKLVLTREQRVAKSSTSDTADHDGDERNNTNGNGDGIRIKGNNAGDEDSSTPPDLAKSKSSTEDGKAEVVGQDPDGPIDCTSDEDSFIDEETLREMVSEMVRSELQGELGARITRNVRKLVRREIQRVLTSREFE